jgi:hypothetical protein
MMTTNRNHNIFLFEDIMYHLSSFLMVSSPLSLGVENPNDACAENLSIISSSCVESRHPHGIATDQGVNKVMVPRTKVSSPVGPNELISPLSLLNITGRDDWRGVYETFRKNPTKLTSTFLIMILKHRPPVSLVTFMLNVNPNAASIPKQGPSALQIAVQRHCSIEVVKELIKACPFALIAINPGTNYDPLSYAKCFRSDEKELIDLLSLPVHHFLMMKNNKRVRDSSLSLHKSYGPVPTKTPKQIDFTDASCGGDEAGKMPSFGDDETDEMITLRPAERAPTCTDSSGLDTTDLKSLCFSMVKKHKYLWNDVLSLQQGFFDTSLASTTSQPSYDMEDDRLDDLELTIMQYHRANRLALEKIEFEMQNNTVKLHGRVNETLHQFEVNFVNAFESRMNTITSCFHFRVQNLTQRIERLESQLQIVMTNDTKEKHNHSSCSFGTKGSRSRHLQGNSNTLPTFSLSTCVDTTPVVFATPWYQTDDDDVRSLLTDDIMFDRKRDWYPLAAGKRFLFSLFRI